MRKLTLLGAIGLLALLAWPIVSSPAPAQSAGRDTCQALLQTTGDGLVVNAATLVTPAPEWRVRGQGGPGSAVRSPFCRVEGMIDRRVGFEMWLPTTDRWNGRMLGAGVGGDAGVFNLSDLSRGVEAGFASITNDSGHKAVETHWMMRKDAVLDYTHRSQHMMNQVGRRLINAYYGKAPNYAYFMGCSGGGRQALTEMQRYPDDYDGIIAGAAGPRMPAMSVRHLWQGLYQQNNPAGSMEDADWKVVADAVNAACDKKDGVVDGVVENPKACKFNPDVVACGKAKAGACLSPAKLATVKAFYAPLMDESGQAIDDGLFPGVRTRPGPPSPLLLPFFGEGAHHDMNWTPAKFKPGADLALALKEMPDMGPNNPDISGFVKRKGRVIIYNGWMDPSIVAGQSLNYYESVRKQMGDAVTNEAVRLYMVPGMAHCGGGEGVNQFGGWDTKGALGEPTHAALSALINWVENGKAPEAIIGSRVENGAITRQRPLCPYPQVAKLTGKDWKQATSYKCVRG